LTWTALDSGLEPDLGVLSLVQAPSDPRRLYAGTDSGALYRSDDAGVSWSRTAFAEAFLPNRLAVDPASSSTVYAAAWDTILKSTDGGEHFIDVRTFSDGVSMLSLQGATLYAGTFQGEIWGSNDGGEEWSRTGALGTAYAAVTALIVDSRFPSTLYVSWMSSAPAPPELDPIGGVMKSIDGGATWKPVEAGIGLTSLLANPADSSVLYAAGLRGSGMRSIDAGATWEDLVGLPDGWVGALAIDPRIPTKLYAGMAGPEAAIGVFTLDLVDRIVNPGGPTNRETRVVARPE
jgi:photosystem II stability/assembly factor-like uncharacterized protein